MNRLTADLDKTEIIRAFRGAWVAQSGKWPTLDFSSGHDLTVCELEPHVSLCADSTVPAWDSLSLSLCPSPALSVSLSVSLKKK